MIDPEMPRRRRSAIQRLHALVQQVEAEGGVWTREQEMVATQIRTEIDNLTRRIMDILRMVESAPPRGPEAPKRS